MADREVEGILLDVDYENRHDASVIRLFVRTEKGIEIFEDGEFKPYFFVTASHAGKAETALLAATFAEGAKTAGIKQVKKTNASNVLMLWFNSVQQLTAARQGVKGIAGVLEKHEYDIPFAKRWLLDHRVQPMSWISASVNGNKLRKLEALPEKEAVLNVTAFDLETLSPGRFSVPEKDPILMASFAEKGKAVVFSYGKKFKADFVEVSKTEQEMLRAFLCKFRESSPDVIATYNGDLFDFPYLKERCSKLGVGLGISADGSAPKVMRKGRDNAVKLHGIQHLDAYQLLRFLSRFAVVNLVKFDLESAVAALFNAQKKKLSPEQINEAWATGKGLDDVASYCKEDAESALRISNCYLPLVTELCRLVKQTLYEVSRSSASMLVEYLIMNKCRAASYLISNKPDDSTVQQRLLQTYKGGFVREPMPGLHENIAVLDFSSLHPTIMISHNVSPDTANCKHRECREGNSAPTKQWFCMKRKGLLSSILSELLERRMQIKHGLKQAGKESGSAFLLDARQHALKILLNSFYGYLGYARSRFYSRECASAVTAWSRQYVKEVGEKAEKAGFKVLYSDTDSEFLIIPKGKGKQDVERFVEQVNRQLPGVMNLELEAFYKRGIFVTKQSGEGAKKRYALIDYSNNLKIVGFEYVRRDWARIAKETQREVIKAILQHGSPEKAIQIVKEKINALHSGKVPKQQLVVLTQLKRPMNKYESIGPHVAAAKKAAAKGKHLGVGSVIGYIVTRSGKSISDKAQLEEYVKEGNYDPAYYIQNQVLPAVMKIIREFNISREDLLQGGKQSRLGAFS